MPLNETDKAWIRQEIQNTSKRHGWSKVTGFIKDWSGLGIIVAIAIAALTQWTSYIEFRTHTGDRLTDIEKNLTSLNLKAQASLPAEEFQSTLTDLRSSIAIAKKESVKVDMHTIGVLQKKLVDTDSSASDFWPTVSTFVSYRSEIQSTPLSGNIPNCTDSLPSLNKVSSIRDLHEIDIAGGVYENCRVTLDSVQDQEKINSLLKNRNMLIIFKHCLVAYRGGNINLIVGWKNHHAKIGIGDVKVPVDAVMNGNAISFEDCIFDFVFSSAPPSNGREVTQALLGTSGNSLTLPRS
jgi:hypothetical protein